MSSILIKYCLDFDVVAERAYKYSLNIMNMVRVNADGPAYAFWERAQRVLLNYVNVLNPTEFPGLYPYLENALNAINDVLFG